VSALTVAVASIDDVLVTKLLALREQDYGWHGVERTKASPFRTRVLHDGGGALSLPERFSARRR
jgi:hypothetical protein